MLFTRSMDLSSQPSSTTINSRSVSVCSSTDEIATEMYASAFRTGITTETKGTRQIYPREAAELN
jgi:hypothetical protein